MRKLIAIALVVIGFTTVEAQEEVTAENPFTISGYIETYYSYDFGNPDNHTRPGFIYSHNRHNEVNLNLGLAKVNYQKDNVRANLALMAGTYANANLSAEPETLKNIYEANIGVKISNNYNLWIDAGILPSHIGFESAIGKDCQTLTRSMMADNSPYYEAGVKVSYTSKSEKWYLAAMYLNGWQRMQKVDGNQTPAFGTQLTYKPSAKTVLNWSTYAGNEQPDSIRSWRYFNNFYGQFKVTEKLNLSAGFDIGVQQTERGSSDYNVWYTPNLIVQFIPPNKIQVACRAEYYQDKKGVIVASGTENGFQTFGLSANFDYLAMENVLFRIEARTLDSKDDVFLKNSNPTNNNVFVTTSMAISF